MHGKRQPQIVSKNLLGEIFDEAIELVFKNISCCTEI